MLIDQQKKKIKLNQKISGVVTAISAVLIILVLILSGGQSAGGLVLILFIGSASSYYYWKKMLAKDAQGIDQSAKLQQHKRRYKILLIVLGVIIALTFLAAYFG